MTDYGDYIRMMSTLAHRTGTAEGYPCHLPGSKGGHILNYRIYGKSIQPGSPSITSPVDIISTGDMVTDESDVNYGKYKIPVVLYGKNFLSCTVPADIYTYGTIINKDCSITVNPGTNASSNPINLKQSKTITIPSDNITITASCKNACSSVTLIVKTKTYGSSTSSYYTLTSGHKTVTLNKGDSIQAYLQMPAGAVLDDVLTLYPQFELGENATEFSPYITPVISNIYLDEPLRKIGDYSDYIDFKKQAVVRNIKNFHIPSNMSWNSWNAVGNGRRLLIYQTTDKLYGDNLTTLGYFNLGTVSQKMSTSNRSNILCAYHSSSSCYWYPDYTVMGLDGSETLEVANAALQTWLKSAGDIYFTYVLAKPKEEKLSLPVIPTQKGDIFVSVNSSFPASNISAKYSKKP